MPESKRLYRFMTAEAAIKTIESKTFRVGRVSEFNDPFEWRLGFKNYNREAGEYLARVIQENHIAGMNSKFGIICFSDTGEDPVLWSHYADKHRGMVLVVDHWVTPALFEVKYAETRPVLEMDRMANEAEFKAHAAEVLKIMLAHKSPGWSYEREYRVYADLATCTAAGGSYFLPIPTDFLKTVILGFKCPLDVAYVRRSLDLAGLRDVAVARASDDNETYKIHF